MSSRVNAVYIVFINTCLLLFQILHPHSYKTYGIILNVYNTYYVYEHIMIVRKMADDFPRIWIIQLI